MMGRPGPGLGVAGRKHAHAGDPRYVDSGSRFGSNRCREAGSPNVPGQPGGGGIGTMLHAQQRVRFNFRELVPEQAGQTAPDVFTAEQCKAWDSVVDRLAQLGLAYTTFKSLG